MSEFCALDNRHFRLVKRLTPGPYAFILRTLLATEKTLHLKRKEAALRIPDSDIALSLIRTHGAPCYSVTAKKSMLEKDGEEAAWDGAEEGAQLIPEELLFEGGWELEAIPGLDLILDSGVEQQRVCATILNLTEDEPVLVRQGTGAWGT
jgi:tRNA A37 threonylcarbamoyladenosine synthetase subunit TsaC/SUA5/YrdC